MSDTLNKIKELVGLKEIVEPTDAEFTAFDDGGVEVETGQLLYAFVRRLKPERVLETGLYSAISTMFIADALKDNNKGHLDGIELEKRHIDRSKKRLQKMGLSSYVTIHHISSLSFKTNAKYQLQLYDTELHLRFHELVRFYKNLDQGGYIFVHDMPRNFCQGNVNPDHPNYKSWPVGELPQKLIDLLKEGKLLPFHFRGARSIVGFYKVKEDDYRVEEVKIIGKEDNSPWIKSGKK